VEVRWSIARGEASLPDAPDWVRITWHERGGPPVSPPQRRGFGSRLIERSSSELDGEMQLAFDPAGLRYAVTIPLNASNSLSM